MFKPLTFWEAFSQSGHVFCILAQNQVSTLWLKTNPRGWPSWLGSQSQDACTAVAMPRTGQGVPRNTLT